MVTLLMHNRDDAVHYDEQNATIINVRKMFHVAGKGVCLESIGVLYFRKMYTYDVLPAA